MLTVLTMIKQTNKNLSKKKFVSKAWSIESN